MNQELLDLAKKLKRKQPAIPSEINCVQNYYNIVLPQDYIEWMNMSNGGSGYVGEDSYLLLWPMEKIIPLNDSHQVSRFVPGLVLFGSDGGGEGYAFDIRSTPISFVQVPLIGMKVENIKYCGITFLEFLRTIESEIG
jgi:hypothetical protein